ncbi:Major facilitator [Trypanosoma melophagium]|uniref:Major facilitator n=1 Tax=Trypanosoma melophagium TaxID=715481 RepID=UPI00351A704E|nr:Major facilitator [Trypanosoma melophagium]
MTTAPDEYPTEERRHSNATPISDDAPAFFSLDNLKVAQVQVVGGTLNGFTIGFVAVYSHFYLISTDCSMYKTPTACNTVLNADCVWNTTSNVCGWKGFTCGLVHNTETACLADKRCNWVYSDEKCTNPVGYSSAYSGIFAGAMIVGAMIGSIFAGRFIARFGHKVSFLVVGIVGVVASVMYHAAAAADQFWVLCVGRLLIGTVLGLVCVACPMYVDQNAHPKNSKVDGVLFQVFTTFGIMLAALMGLALGQSINYSTDIKMVGRMQGFCAFSTTLSLLMVGLGISLGESKTRFTGGKGGEGDSDALDPNEYGYVKMIGPMLIGVTVAGTLQLTGINAVMNYAPTIMGRLGMEALVGNAVVMIWNFVTTLVSIPLASFLTMRQLFIACSLVGSLACLFLCGVPVYPGLASGSVKNGVAITGIAVFIAAFEFGIGPCFYVLAQDLFPPSFRPKGSSFVTMVNFIFNVVINVCYPIATEALSGGPSGDQDKGQSIAFIFFGCIGLACFVLQVFFLFPWEDKKAGSGDAEHHSDSDGRSPVELGKPGNVHSS